jgi:CHAT domain-containing protein/Tfp pilus assembly protein PilF
VSLASFTAAADGRASPAAPTRSESVTAREIGSLTVDRAIEHEVGRGQEDRYQIDLAAGEYARIVVEQRALDAVVDVRDPDGTLIASFDDDNRRGGSEHIEVVADRDGTYVVGVRTVPGTPAGTYVIRVIDRRTAVSADRSMQDARTLRTNGRRLFDEDKTEEAQPLFERALALTEKARGSGDEQFGRVLADNASIALDLLDFAGAESQYQRALAVLDATLGADDPTTAFVRSRLAVVYQLTGQRPKAETLIRAALETIERTLGSEHPQYVRCLAVLAALRNDAKDFDQSEALLTRELAILEKVDYAQSLMYAKVLNNLGEINGRKKAYDRAVDFLNRSIAVDEALRGSDDYFLSNPLTNLGIIARERRDYATAESYYRRALSIREQVVGPDHPELMLPLINLANIYHARGDYPRALEMHRHALRIGERTFGPLHQNTLLSLVNIAKDSAAEGDIDDAIAFQRRVDEVIERQLELNLSVGSERQKLVFVKGISERTDRTLSLHLDRAPQNADAGALAALVLLQRKGRVLDAMVDAVAAARERMAPDDQRLLDELHDATAQLAHVALNAPEIARPDARQRAMRELEARKEQLEAALAERSLEFRSQAQPVTLEAVQARLPSDTALIEFAIFRPFNPRAERSNDAYGAPHYAAYVIRHAGAPRGIDLGSTQEIDETVDLLRQTIRDPNRSDFEEHARALNDRVVAPLHEFVQDAARLLVSPDGELNLVPFEALVDAHGSYLVERYAVSYLTSGRDLLRMQTGTASLNPVIFADPNFGEPGPRAPSSRKSPPARLARRSVTTGDDLSSVYFAPLVATGSEARAIKALFPDAALFTGARATKAMLQHVESPRMLHIASHGFFLHDSDGDLQNPLLRSGLALAGANLPHESRDGGILTALEASGLNLRGTKLVTLSACDTGVGEVRNGEGVYGLRRAFVLAGAETVVMSLWPVSDYVTREMMVAYYTGLRATLGRGDALRQAKLAMLQRTSRRHPFYWASFIQSGEWTPIDDTP